MVRLVVSLESLCKLHDRTTSANLSYGSLFTTTTDQIPKLATNIRQRVPVLVMSGSIWRTIRDQLRIAIPSGRRNKRLNAVRLESRIVPAIASAPATLALDTLDPTLASAIEREWTVDSQTQTSRWVVHVADGQSSDAFVASGATMTPVAAVPNTYVAEWPEAHSVAVQGDAIADVGAASWFYPLVPRQQELRFIPNDPHFGSQWHLLNSGQSGGTVGADIRATTAWDVTTTGGAPVRGDGVVVAIVDNGLQYTHPDLAANYSAAYSFDFNNNDSDPSPISSGYHGTAIAGVIGAKGNNDIGVTGVAPNASLAGLRLIAGPTDDALEAAALSYHPQDIDIYNSSWGPRDGVEWLSEPGPMTQAAIANGVQSGRGGLGNVYLWAAGNGRTSNDNINYDGYANSRYVIAVGAIDNNGKQAWYSEPGAPMLVTAYSGGNSAQITTTDLMGSSGKNGLPDLNYTNQFTGTSASSPIAAGVVALLLQVNPNLSYRDVKHILVSSARKNDPTDVDWIVNGAGHSVNHKYGFGAIDAEGAVLLAKHWTTVGTELIFNSGPVLDLPLAIPDNNSIGVTSSFDIPDNLRVEHVEVNFDATHASRGQLEVILTSPSGTDSILAEQHGDMSADYSGWVFSTVRHWDESSAGTWTLRVRDRVSGVIGTLDQWAIRVSGAAQRGPTLKDVETSPIEYLENATVPLSSSLTIDLPPSGLLSGAAVMIASGFHVGEDQLTFTNQNGITGTFVDNRLTLTGIQFKSEYEAALRSIRYHNTSNDPNAASRIILFQASDVTGVPGAPVFRNIRVNSINDAPSFTIGPDVNRNEDSGQQVLSAWATNVSAGESSQKVSFEIVSNSNPALFVSGPAVAADGTLTFESATNAFGTVTIQVRLSDNGGTVFGGVDASDVQSFTITIDPVNDAPIAVDDQFQVNEDTAFPIIPAMLLVNDDDVERDSLVPTNLTQPAHGSLSLNADGSYLYTPNQDFFGTDSFTYTASDGLAESIPTTVMITVLPVNDRPTAIDDWSDVTSSRPVRIPVLNNDVDADNEVTRLVSYSRPQKGRLTRDGNALSYLPVAGAVGTDFFSYMIADQKGATNTATVHLNLVDTTPPRVVAVRIWNGTRFINLSGSTRYVLPWSNVHRIQYVFSEPVNIDSESVSLIGAAAGPIPLNRVYDAARRTLTVSFNKLLSDRYNLRLNAAGVRDLTGNVLSMDWARSFAILPGDFDGNGFVDNRDLLGIRRSFSAPGKPYNGFADIDGNRIVNALDYAAARLFFGRGL